MWGCWLEWESVCVFLWCVCVCVWTWMRVCVDSCFKAESLGRYKENCHVKTFSYLLCSVLFGSVLWVCVCVCFYGVCAWVCVCVGQCVFRLAVQNYPNMTQCSVCVCVCVCLHTLFIRLILNLPVCRLDVDGAPPAGQRALHSQEEASLTLLFCQTFLTQTWKRHNKANELAHSWFLEEQLVFTASF